MSVTISSIKKEAKATLKGKYVIAIIASLAILFAFFIIQNICWVLSVVIGEYAATVLLFLFSVLFCGPLVLGVFRCYWRMYNGLTEPPAVIFYYFSNFKNFCKCVKVTFKIAVRFIAFLIIFSIPSTVIYVISNPEMYKAMDISTPVWTQEISQLGDLLSLIALLITLIVCLKYYIAPMLIILNDDIEPDEALHMSSVIAKSSFIDYIYLVFNMAHWIIISLLFIPLIFTMPYFIMAYVVHISHAINDYNEKINKLNDANLPSFVAGV